MNVSLHWRRLSLVFMTATGKSVDWDAMNRLHREASTTYHDELYTTACSIPRQSLNAIWWRLPADELSPNPNFAKPS